METITITIPTSNIISIVDLLIYNIYYCKEVEFDIDGIEQVIELYENELEKLKPILKERDLINYTIYNHCDWDFEKHQSFIQDTDELGLDMEG